MDAASVMLRIACMNLAGIRGRIAREAKGNVSQSGRCLAVSRRLLRDWLVAKVAGSPCVELPSCSLRNQPTYSFERLVFDFIQPLAVLDTRRIE